ncbi:MAG: addiction module protein [Verrucomicrobiota bacterium]|jgi:hypothetical protein
MTVELPLAAMSAEEKLRTLEILWNDLRANEENIPVPQWHRDLLDERSRMVCEGKATFSDWETAKVRISARARGEN